MEESTNTGAVKKLIDFAIAFLVLVIIFFIVTMVKDCRPLSDKKNQQPKPSSIENTTSPTETPSTPTSTSATTPARQQTRTATSEPITVEVLNGVGKSGLAYRVRDYLLNNYNRRIDVLNYENASSFNYEKTMIIDRRKPHYDEKVSTLQSLTGIETVVYQRYECGVDASIILGADWAQYFPDLVREMK